MYHRPSKKAQVTKLAIIYTIMTSVVLIVVSAMVFYALGYRFNQTDGAIEQGSLVQFSSTPRGADVQFDGLTVGGRTPTRDTAVAGNHQASYQLDGYREWRKSFTTKSGDVLWLDYARMIPNQVQTTTVADYDELDDVSVSPNDDYMLMQKDSSQPEFSLVDIRKDDIASSTLTLPSKVYTTPTNKAKQSFKVDSWSQDNDYVLIKHTFGKNHEWILVKRSDAKSAQNLTTLFGIDAKSMVMASSNAIYINEAGTIRLLNVAKETISKPLVKNVKSYDYQGGVLIYSTKPAKKTYHQTVGYFDTRSDKAVTLRQFNDKSIKTTDVAVDQYYHSQYVAIAVNGAVDIYEGDLPRSSSDNSLQKIATISLKNGSVKYLNFSPGGQYVYAQHGDSFATYDLATETGYSTTLKGQTKVTERIQWLDNHTLWSDRSNTLRFYDFDGANQQDIASVSPNYDVAISPNDKYVYSVVESKSDSMVLQRSQLILDN